MLIRFLFVPALNEPVTYGIVPASMSIEDDVRNFLIEAASVMLVCSRRSRIC